MASGNYNVKNTAIKRIHADVRELSKEPSDQYHAAPLEENLFEWHFTIRGPPSTEFEGGIYHGRILLPPDYPFKPPNIVLLTPNGRFKVGEKICLSISAHHPEYWQPAWGVRLILEALISFLPTEGKGALGSLDWTPEERRNLANQSQEWVCPKCGLAKELLPELREPSANGAPDNKYLEQIAQLHMHGVPSSPEKKDVDDKSDFSSHSKSTGEILEEKEEIQPDIESSENKKEDSTKGDTSSTNDAKKTNHDPIPLSTSSNSSPKSTIHNSKAGAQISEDQRKRKKGKKKNDDHLLYIIYGLLIAILALVLRKVLKAL